MRRVVVSGLGIVSAIGNNTQEVLGSLREGRSGVSFAERYKELGFRCQVHGAPQPDPADELDRRTTRFMGRGAAWNYIAMRQAIQDSGLEKDEVSNERTGHHHGVGRPLHARDRRGGRRHAREGRAAGRPVRGAEGDVVHEFRHLGHARSRSRA